MKVLFSIKEATDALGISRSYLYELKKAGLVCVKKWGSRSLIHRDEIERLGRELPVLQKRSGGRRAGR